MKLEIGEKFDIQFDGKWYKVITEIVLMNEDKTAAIIRYTEDDGIKGIANVTLRNGEWGVRVRTGDRGQEIDEKELNCLCWGMK